MITDSLTKVAQFVGSISLSLVIRKDLGKKCILKPDAIPLVFAQFPEHLKNTRPSRKSPKMRQVTEPANVELSLQASDKESYVSCIKK